MDLVKAQTYKVPVAICFETLGSLLPDMGVTVQSSDAQTGQMIGEYQNMVAHGESAGPVVAIKATCTALYSNTTMVKLSCRDADQPDTAAPAIEAKMVAILNTLNNRLGQPAVRRAIMNQAGITAPMTGVAGGPVEQARVPGTRQFERDPLDYAWSADETRNHKAAAVETMVWGAIWGVGGIVVTVGSYTIASGGGTYIITWGAIIYGAIRFFKGLAQYLES